MPATKAVRGKCLFVYTMAALIAAMGLQPALAAAQDPPLDHFTVYGVVGGTAGPTVILDDQFDPFHEVDLEEPIFFMPPAQKNFEPVYDTYSHLTCYLIPPDSPGAWSGGAVDVVNQLGPQTLAVLDPVALCVPTEKLWMPPATLRDTHYKCYDAFGEPALLPPPGVVFDQFQEQYLAPDIDPFLFCNPVYKQVDDVGYPPSNYIDHLTCYNTFPPGMPVSPFFGPIPISNQFHFGELEVMEPFGLCVPSDKLDVRTFTPAPTDTHTATPTATATLTPSVTQTPTETPTPVAVPTCPTTPLIGVCANPGKALIKMKRKPGDPSKSKFLWKWLKGTASTPQFGDPTSSTAYTLCVYDGNSFAASLSVMPGGMCGTKPCWKQLGPAASPKGYKYKNKATNSDGVFKMLLKEGTGKAKILVKGKGSSLSLPLPVAQTLNVTVQLFTSSTPNCWESVFPAPALKNVADQFKDKIP